MQQIKKESQKRGKPVEIQNMNLEALQEKREKLQRLSGKLMELQKEVNQVTENFQQIQESCQHNIGIRTPDDEYHEYATCMECGKQFQIYKEPRYPFHVDGYFKHVIHMEKGSSTALAKPEAVEKAYEMYAAFRNADANLSDEEIVAKINNSFHRNECLER